MSWNAGCTYNVLNHTAVYDTEKNALKSYSGNGLVQLAKACTLFLRRSRLPNTPTGLSGITRARIQILELKLDMAALKEKADRFSAIHKSVQNANPDRIRLSGKKNLRLKTPGMIYHLKHTRNAFS